MKPMRMATLGAGLISVLSGCDPSTADRPLNERLGQLFSGGGETAPDTEEVGTGVQYVGETRDVEAPEIFEVTDQALWDGRPSLGGTWIAHPDVKEPQRVLIRDISSGKSITGALFRRERENPGPVFQLSSDAASELGVLAGTPVSVKVTALRKQEVETPALPLPTGADAVATGTVSSDAEQPAEVVEPVTQPAAQTSAAATAASVAPAAIEASSIDPIAAAEAALARSDSIVLGETVAQPAPEQRPETLQEPVSQLGKPFIQAGIFSKKTNADATAERLQSAGLTPETIEQQSRGQTIWRVVVGPAFTRSDRRGLLAQIRDLGFKDAYAVAG